MIKSSEALLIKVKGGSRGNSQPVVFIYKPNVDGTGLHEPLKKKKINFKISQVSFT